MDYYGWLVLKFLIGFLLLLFYLNISGKTQLSQLTPIDFIGNFILGGIIGGITYNDKISIFQYLAVLIIGIFIIFCLNFFSRHFFLFRRITSGEPIPIIKNSQFIMENILKKKNKIDILSIASQLHVKGICKFSDIFYAQIEPDGQLTVVLDKRKMSSEIIMHNGKIRTSALQRIEKDEKWLTDKLKKIKIIQENVFLCEFWNGSLLVILKNGDTKKITK